MDIPSKEIGTIITGLRTGYSHLNKYRNNLGQTETPLCSCGQEETTEHYLLHCPQYEHQREIMCQRLRQEFGYQQITAEELLATERQFNELKQISDILGDYISDSGHFPWLACPNDS